MSPLTKARRRRENFGRRRNHRGELVIGDTVRPTPQRTRFAGEHSAPRDWLNDNGTRWAGFSKRSSRKPWPAERSWRRWLRDTGIDAWRRQSEATTPDEAQQ